jgi:hypothetical protein
VQRTCAECGRSYEAKRSTSLYCCGSCRTMAHLTRDQKAPSPILAPMGAKLFDPGIDPADVDPLQVLREIAADRSAPAAARVAACKLLLADAQKAVGAGPQVDPVTAKAIERLRRLN